VGNFLACKVGPDTKLQVGRDDIVGCSQNIFLHHNIVGYIYEDKVVKQ